MRSIVAVSCLALHQLREGRHPLVGDLEVRHDRVHLLVELLDARLLLLGLLHLADVAAGNFLRVEDLDHVVDPGFVDGTPLN